MADNDKLAFFNNYSSGELNEVRQFHQESPMKVQLKFRDFESQILYFNGMYKLPIAPYPCTSIVINDEMFKRRIVNEINTTIRGKDYIVQRLRAFKKTLVDEINEVDEILEKVEGSVFNIYNELEFLTELADWLTDIQVYCASEMVKFGIPIKESQKIVMSSNFSKQGENGKTIYDDNGKVLKGPNYWKPEPLLKEMLVRQIDTYMDELANKDAHSS